MAITALALTATTANAQIEVLEEDGPGHCTAVSLSPTGHVVSGGCPIEYRSEHHVPLVAYTPAPVIVSNCNVHLSARIGENGAGYVTAASLTAETVNPPVPGCTRAACDENGPVGASAMLPWPVQITETAAGVETVDATFCLRTISSLEGGPQTHCGVHLPYTSPVTHDNEVGDNAEYFCEVAAIPTSIRNLHLINEVSATESTEDIEVIH
jgi:hypothetical protein